MLTVFHDLLFQPAIAPLLLMARVTERIRLGPSALNPYTLHPVELAGQAAALDLASSGRAYLGVVQGAWLDQLGLAERQSLGALREAVEIVRRLLAGDRTGLAGDHFQLAEGSGLAYPPLRAEIPLLVGTWGRRTMAWAGTVAREIKLGGCANPDMVRQARAWIGNDDVGIVAGCVTVVDEDGSRARAHVPVPRCSSTCRSSPGSIPRSTSATTTHRPTIASPSPARPRRSPRVSSRWSMPEPPASSSARPRD